MLNLKNFASRLASNLWLAVIIVTCAGGSYFVSGAQGPIAGGIVSVQGRGADGSAVVGFPVRIAGKDGSGNTQDILTDTGGAIQVDVESSALPTGAATAANQTTVIGHLDGVEGLLTTIDADTGTLAGAVVGSEVQVDVVGALPAGTNNIGDVDVASIAAGDNNIGNVDIVTMPAVTVSGTVTVDQTDAATADYDSGGGTVNNVMFGLALPGAGGPVAGGTSANPLNVVFPSAQAVTQSGNWTARLADGAGNLLTSKAPGSEQALSVAIVDGSGNQVTSFGGTGGTSMTDDAAFTPASTAITPIGFVFDDVSPDSVNEGDAGAPRMSANRVQYGIIRDAAGNERGANVDASGNLMVNLGVRLDSTNDSVDTELPTPAALADNASNPTAPAIGSFLMLFDGSTWDRAPGNSTDGLLVNLGANNDVTVTTFPDNEPFNFAQLGGNSVNTGNGTAGTGTLRVAIASDNTSNTNPWLVNEVPRTSGGLLISRTISAASTNATSAKASAGQVYAIYAHNINAAVRYLKLYNKASAPTVGTDTPVATLPIPADAAGNGFVLPIPAGLEFTTGIAYALTTGVADSDTGAVAANEIVINLLYK